MIPSQPILIFETAKVNLVKLEKLREEIQAVIPTDHAGADFTLISGNPLFRKEGRLHRTALILTPCLY